MGGIAGKPKKVTVPRLVVVFGATGCQGGSVAAALIEDSGFKVRAVTRNPESDKAKALAEKGAEVVTADIDDVDSLKSALDGAYAVFGVTDHKEHREKEVQQGKNIVDACKEKNVRHLVYSGLENIKEAIGKACSNFDGKSEVEAYIKDQGVPHTFVRYAFYYENIFSITKPQKTEEDDTYILAIPMEGKPLHMVAANETGPCILEILKQSKMYLGKAIGLASHLATVPEYADILTKHIEGKTFKAGEMTAEQFGQQGFPGAANTATMFEYLQSGKWDRDVALTKKLNPKISNFEEWVEANTDAIVAALDD